MMTNDEAVTMLLDRLGVSAAAVGEAQLSECRSILAEALALEERLPTDWFEVWDRVTAVAKRHREEPSGSDPNGWPIWDPL
jgi:hypothetical protein